MFSQTSQVRKKMYEEFNSLFQKGRHFPTAVDLAADTEAFGKKYNVVFSIYDSHVKRGQYYYRCKHAGSKRILKGNQEDPSLTEVDESGDEIIDLTEKKNDDIEEKAPKAPYKKLTQKFSCGVFFNVNK